MKNKLNLTHNNRNGKKTTIAAGGVVRSRAIDTNSSSAPTKQTKMQPCAPHTPAPPRETTTESRECSEKSKTGQTHQRSSNLSLQIAKGGGVCTSSSGRLKKTPLCRRLFQRATKTQATAGEQVSASRKWHSPSPPLAVSYSRAAFHRTPFIDHERNANATQATTAASLFLFH